MKNFKDINTASDLKGFIEKLVPRYTVHASEQGFDFIQVNAQMVNDSNNYMKIILYSDGSKFQINTDIFDGLLEANTYDIDDNNIEDVLKLIEQYGFLVRNDETVKPFVISADKLTGNLDEI